MFLVQFSNVLDSVEHVKHSVLDVKGIWILSLDVLSFKEVKLLYYLNFALELVLSRDFEDYGI